MEPKKNAKQSHKIIKKYQRDPSNIKIRNLEDRKLKTKLRQSEAKAKQAAYNAAQSEILLTQDEGVLEADGLERTWKFSQSLLKQNVDLNTQRKMFNLKLNDFGPYTIDYTRNGRDLLLGGRKGHLASFDWQTGKLGCELNVAETIRDVTWLHNNTMFAVAQKKYTFIYDKTGMELHCLKDHIEANKLTFLPYHFLLCSVGNAGYLKYQDTSTGQLIVEHRTKLGKCDTMAQNPYNAIINLGHSNGTVTLWSPTMSTPLVKMLCHQGPVQAISLDNSGHYMATSGLDGQLKVWDIRTYKSLHSYFTPKPASTLSFSAKGLLAVGAGSRLTVWKDIYLKKQKEPYMTHIIEGSGIQDLAFCPFEDILGAGHANGFSSLVIPGSGEPNFDTFEANPYQTVSQRQESEVHALLDKIQPDMITLDPTFIGKIDRVHTEVLKEESQKAWEANNPTEKFVPANKKRGKSSAQNRYLRKQMNVIDEKRMAIKEIVDKRAKDHEKRKKGQSTEETRTALDRFK
ncbi:WD40-repeat-containing domain protein [Globomyces pollinis-pini]|nr:WD40-repeat-containing domain protein [Globomyces pollinis-pini]KAJ2994168.1 Small subunit (SSU) processome component [Globomyces sp. JEL0801]